MEEHVVLIERIGRVGIITLNRPQQLNALNDAVMDQLGDLLLALDADEGIGAIVLTGGAERQVCAPGDQTRDAAWRRRNAALASRSWQGQGDGYVPVGTPARCQ